MDSKSKVGLPCHCGEVTAHITAAEEAGAVGVIIYSDPADDGGITEENGYKPYPEGPARQPSSVQRGSVQYVRLIQLARADAHVSFPSTPAIPRLLATRRTRTRRGLRVATSHPSRRKSIRFMVECSSRPACRFPTKTRFPFSKLSRDRDERRRRSRTGGSGDWDTREWITGPGLARCPCILSMKSIR